MLFFFFLHLPAHMCSLLQNQMSADTDFNLNSMKLSLVPDLRFRASPAVVLINSYFSRWQNKRPIKALYAWFKNREVVSKWSQVMITVNSNYPQFATIESE